MKTAMGQRHRRPILSICVGREGRVPRGALGCSGWRGRHAGGRGLGLCLHLSGGVRHRCGLLLLPVRWVLRSGGRRRSHSRDLAPEVAFPSNSVPASVTWGRSARCLLPPHQAQARGGAGARGAAAWAIPGLGSGRSLRPPGRPRGNKARAPPRAVSGLPGPRPVQPPRLWLAGARLRLPRAHPSVSRGPAAPAPRAPPPPPAPRRRRRCATCLQLGAHRARLRPGAPAAGEGLGLRAGPALERGSASHRPRPRPGAAVDPRARPANSAGDSRAQPVALNAGASVGD